MRSLLVFLVAAIVATAQPAVADSAAPAATAAVQVPLLTIEALVLDRDGKAVDGLTKSDFEVLYNSRAAEVENFHVVKKVQREEPPHVAVFIDDVHLRRRGKQQALEALRVFFDRLDSRATATLLVWNGAMEVRVPPTSDRTALRRALARIDGELPLGSRYDDERRLVLRMIDHAAQSKTAPEALTRRMTDFAETHGAATRQTIEALRKAVRAMPRGDGRKVLLYVSDGLPLQPGVEVVDYWSRLMATPRRDRAPLDATGDLLALTREAKSAGVTLSSIELAEEGEPRVPTAARMIAEETGGRYVAGNRELPRVMEALTGAVSNVYSLRVRVLPVRHPSLDVLVRNRKDLYVLAAFRTSTLLEESVNVALRARLYSRESSNALDARVQFGAAWPDARRCRVPVQVMIPAGKLVAGADGQAEFSVRAMVLDHQQRESKVQYLVRKLVPRPDALVMESIAFGLPPSRYVVSLAILDHVSGETSYIQSEIDTTICGS